MSESDIPANGPTDDQQESSTELDNVKCGLTENSDSFMKKVDTIFDKLNSNLKTIIQLSNKFNNGKVNDDILIGQSESEIDKKQNDCMEFNDNVDSLEKCNYNVSVESEMLQLCETECVQNDEANIQMEEQIQEGMEEGEIEIQEERVPAEELEKKEESTIEEVDVNIETSKKSENPESQEYEKLRYEWTKPTLVCKASKEFQPTEVSENFTKGCHWSPDGTCILVPSEDFKIRIFELPRDLYSGVLPRDFHQPDFNSTLRIKEGGTIYDSCWFPYMNSWDPTTCCFLSTSQGSPVHMWDAFTGQLRATYRAYNQVDEVEAAISLQFTELGGQIWCGFKNSLRIFDTDRPGRQIKNIFLKKDFPNVTGLVSCIRENPMMPGFIAFGTYSKCIGLYKDGPICTFKTSSGVTQIEFSPCGTKIYSAVRRDGEFLCWDLRNPGTVLYSLDNRQSNTNQRIWFNLSYNEGEIISGGTDGLVRVWKVPNDLQEEEDINSTYNIKVSKDCVNGVSLHKNLPILAASTGERKCDVDGNNFRDNSLHLYWLSNR